MRHRFIYKTTHLPSGRFYIGLHETENIDDGYLGSGVILQQLLQAHPREEFDREILSFCKTREELTDQERSYIREAYDDPNSLNIALGGDGGDTYAIIKQLDPVRYEQLIIDCAARLSGERGNRALQEKRKADLQFDQKIKDLLRNNMRRAGQTANTPEALAKKKKTFAERGHQKGSNNNQFGTMWITDGASNRKLKKDEPIPPGWKRGRTITR